MCRVRAVTCLVLELSEDTASRQYRAFPKNWSGKTTTLGVSNDSVILTTQTCPYCPQIRSGGHEVCARFRWGGRELSCGRASRRRDKRLAAVADQVTTRRWVTPPTIRLPAMPMALPLYGIGSCAICRPVAVAEGRCCPPEPHRRSRLGKAGAERSGSLGTRPPLTVSQQAHVNGVESLLGDAETRLLRDIPPDEPGAPAAVVDEFSGRHNQRAPRRIR